MSNSATCSRIPSIRVRNSRNEAGTLAARNSRKKLMNTAALAALAAVQKGKPLEQLHILLVFKQCAVQGRDQLFGVARAQHLGRDVLDEQQLDPVEQFGGRWLLLQSRHITHIEEDRQRLMHEVVLQAGE